MKMIHVDELGANPSKNQDVFVDLGLSRLNLKRIFYENKA